MSFKMKIVRTLVKKMSGGMFASDDIDVAGLRARLAKAYAQHTVEDGVTMEVRALGGVETAFFTPDRLASDDVIYYVHGGGLVTGDCRTAGPYASELALATGRVVVSCSYRLAPEDPYPAGLDDSFAVYEALVSQNPGAGVALIGESGGAYLSALVAMKAREAGLRMPSCLVLNSLVADMSETVVRVHTRKEITVTPVGLAALARMYAPGCDLTDPMISPIFAELAGLPPMRLVCDPGELLAADTHAFAAKARTAGIHVEVEEYPGTFHAFTTTGKNTPESKREIELSAAFMVRYLEAERVVAG
ncbi:alpha/beta hydrolase [Demequina soli]|uniref:alpha/beta hydrolase n=1 Tax=Demequina soli TaxID=1638987 RepID=UPI0007812AF9|nr:alpha/beta hydrolase [Demequina soli]